MDEIIKRLQETFNLKDIWAFIVKLLPNLIVAIIILIVFYLIWIVVIRILILILKKSKIDKTISTFVITVTKYVIMIVGIIVALTQIGVNVTSLLASLGVVGITIGYALRNSIANIISGVYIFLERTYVINDLIEIDGNYGKVSNITLRCTTIISPEGKIVSIPNSFVFDKVVTTYANYQNIRIETKFSVMPNENIDFIRKILLESFNNNESYCTDPNPELVVNSLNINSVDLILRAWIKDEKEHLKLTNSLRENVYKILNNNNITVEPETIYVKQI